MTQPLARTPAYQPAGPVLFRSGFESGTRGIPANAHEILEGVDHSVAPPNDWTALRAQLPPSHPWATGTGAAGEAGARGAHPTLGYFDIQYLGGTVAQRSARIIEDPTCPGNQVLHFRAAHANETFPGGAKARVQASLYGNRNLTALCSRVRLYLHPDLDVLREWDAGFDWLTLQEFWFSPGWVPVGRSFRISLGLHREAGAGRRGLHFYVHGQPGWEDGMPVYPKYGGWGFPTWEQVGRAFDVPTGTWLDCRVFYRMGDAVSGRFVFQVRIADGDWIAVFDVTDWTYNPRSAGPDPLYGWNPMKLYTSSRLVDYVRDRGGVAQVYWDDLEIHGDWIDNERE